MRTSFFDPPHHTIILHGDLDIFNKATLRASLDVAQGWKRVTVDISDVAFMDAAALGEFVHLYNTMHREDAHPTVQLVGVQPNIARLFSVTKLDSLFALTAGPIPQSVPAVYTPGKPAVYQLSR